MTTTYEGERCPTCGESKDVHLLECTPTADTWTCRECGWTWVIEVELPAQTQTELTERAETHG